MKNKIIITLMLVCFIVLAPIVLADVEPNDSMETAEEITQGVYNGTLIGDDVTDWYVIHGLLPGQGIVVTTETTTNMTFGAFVDMRIYSYDNQSMDYKADNVPGTFTVRAAEGSRQENYSYYIQISSGNDIAYSFNLTVMDYFDADLGIDAGDTNMTAAPIEVGNYTGYLYGTDELDYYMFSGLGSGQELRINCVFTPWTEEDEPFGINGVLLYSEDMDLLIDRNPNELDRTISWLAGHGDPDTIIIEVNAFQSFSYELQVMVNDYFDADSGGDVGSFFNNSYTIRAGEIQGHLGPTGDDWKYQSGDDLDMYNIELRSGENLTIQLGPAATLEPAITIYNENIEEVATENAPSVGETFEIRVESTTDELYYIELGSQLGYGGYLMNVSIESPYGEILITVEDEDGSPISGATVESTSVPAGQVMLQGTADSNGIISFSSLMLGEYTLNVTMDGYFTETVTVQVDEATRYEETVALTGEPVEQEFGGIILTVEDSTGSPIMGATVESTSVPTEQDELSGTTDSDGVVSFEELVLGSYTFSVTMQGYLSETVTVELSEPTTVEETVSLESEPSNGDGLPEWIPGFPIEAVILAFVLLALYYWIKK